MSASEAIRTEVPLPEEVSASTDGFDLRVEGPNGTVEKRLWYPDVTVRVDSGAGDDGEDLVVVESDADDRETAATVGTFESHVRNAVHGVTEGWEYRMEVEYAHFPMKLRVEDGEVVIENFLGERAPRRTQVVGDTDVTVQGGGEELVLRGPDKEDVGQTAGNVEQLTRITDKDPRKFEDGVYITERPDSMETYG